MSQLPLPKSAGRPQKSDAEREFQRAKIIAAATQVVRHSGPDVSIDAIAAAAGYTKPVVYELFGSKSGLAVALSFQLLGDRLQAGVQHLGSDPQSTVRALIAAYVDAVERDPNIYRFVVIGARSGTASFVEQPMFMFLSPMVASAIGAAEPYATITAGAVFSAIFATIEDWSIAKHVSAGDLVSYLDTLVHAMIKTVANTYSPKP